MRISVVIPVKDDERIIAATEAVMAVVSEVDEAEVFVVDNGSPPSFDATLARLPSGVRLLRESKPGAYAARNRAIAEATGEFVFFTDADALVRPGWIREGLRAFADGADIACGYSGSIGTSHIDRLIQASFDGFCAPHSRGDPLGVNTRNVAIRRHVINAIGFDDRFGRGGDAAFGRLAAYAGYRLFFAPDMVADHQHEPDLPLRAAKHVCWGWNSMRLAAEHPELAPFPPGPWIPRARRLSRVTHLPVLRIASEGYWLTALAIASFVQLCAPILPWTLARKLTDGGAMRTARRAGLLLYASGRTTQPKPSEVLRRRMRRD